MDDEELKKRGDELRRSDSFVLIGAVVFAAIAVILAASLVYVWVARS